MQTTMLGSQPARQFKWIVKGLSPHKLLAAERTLADAERSLNDTKAEVLRGTCRNAGATPYRMRAAAREHADETRGDDGDGEVARSAPSS
jgi:hypothetical protein